MLRALSGEVPDRPPFWFMRQAGRYLPEYRALRKQAADFLSFCYTPALTLEAALQPLRRFEPDAAILFSDILVIPDALGQAVRFEEGVGPVLEPIRHGDDLANLAPGRVCERLMPVFEAVGKLAATVPAETAVIGFAGAPWTVAYYMIEGRSGADGSNLREWAYGSPDTFRKLIDKLVEATAAYLVEQINHGAEIVQLFDSWAGLAGVSQFDSWIAAPTREIVARIKAAHPETPVIGFPRGAGVQTATYAAKTGVDGVGLDSTIPPVWARDHVQKGTTVQGNLDNMILRLGGAGLERETREILGALADGPFIFNLGHGILPQTPPENVARVAEIVRGFARAR